MKIMFNGGLYGREGLCYLGREIVKQLSKNHTIEISGQPMEGYWSKFYGNFKSGEEDIYLMNGHPLALPLLAKKHKHIIHITIFETKLGDKQVECLNLPQVKQIWTISEFAKTLIEDSGVNKPIEVIYLGLDERFKKTDINLFPRDKSFKFFNICAPHCVGVRDRKGLDILIPAFKEEFGDDLKVTLLIKINTVYADTYHREFGGFNIYDYIKKFLPKGMKLDNVAILTDYYSTVMVNNLYNSVHCGVFPSRGEGFGLPQSEMIKIGKPVITTDYSATNEFSCKDLRINIDGLYPLDVELDIDDYCYADNTFAEPNKEHLKKLMRKVYDNYESWRKKGLCLAASERIKSFDWNKIGSRLNELVKKVKEN